MIAVASISFAGIPAEAKTVIKTDHGRVVIKDHHRRHCRTKVVKHWKHHRMIVEKIRVCG
ncbi:hypothetical protein LB579_31775 [Mesorhizobium sp. BR1-1-7]|nr:hypothetical protein [Mesorhizobium sp. BR1-1-7]MBZ9922257.1 hypothetical protein [Mesorhizobium sp. BR1-1-7]